MNIIKRIANKVLYRLFGHTPYREDKLEPDRKVRTVTPEGYNPNENKLFDILMENRNFTQK